MLLENSISKDLQRTASFSNQKIKKNLGISTKFRLKHQTNLSELIIFYTHRNYKKTGFLMTSGEIKVN